MRGRRGRLKALKWSLPDLIGPFILGSSTATPGSSGMARLPHGEGAILDLEKIEDYCLDATHPRGRHKARVFRETLGIDRSHASWLRDALLAAMREADATELQSDMHGQRWRVDIPVARQDRRIVVRTVWIVRTGEQVPRFVTCWVL
jgi:hypothetical protein